MKIFLSYAGVWTSVILKPADVRVSGKVGCMKWEGHTAVSGQFYVQGYGSREASEAHIFKTSPHRCNFF